MALSLSKLQAALKKGVNAFKADKRCKVSVTKPDKVSKMVLATIDLDGVYGVSSSLMVCATTDRISSFEMHIHKTLLVNENDFNYKHKLFFHKSGTSYKHNNYICFESDLTELLKAYADYMLNGDFYKAIRG